jgi:uncharacterized protein DUF4214
MKTQIANSTRLDILGNGNCSSDQEVLNSILKKWRHKLGYWSIFAAVPAILASHVTGARSDNAKKSETIVAGESTRLREKLRVSWSDPTLLKRQSQFLLPHQKGSSSLLDALPGNDDCPGRIIPGGNYTAATPYTGSGDTSGANDTVTSLSSFYYYSYDAHGPDLVYSFTLTGRGENPQLQVSSTSGTYQPMIYILQDGTAGGCPSGTGNHLTNDLLVSDSRWVKGSSTATFDSPAMNSLPLNVPLHLFVDSAQNDANGSGPYTLRMQDVTIASTACPNPNSIDCSEFFVRQHYLDFLSREPETSGYTAWLNVLNNCPDVNNFDPSNASAACDRITVSADFFNSTEFQLKGYYVFRFYRLAFDRLPTYTEMIADMQSVTGATSDEVYAKKATYASAFSQRPEFTNTYGAMSNDAFVTALLNRLGETTITTPDPMAPDGLGKVSLTASDLTTHLNAGTLSRAQVLRAVTDSDQITTEEFNRAFVAMEYYGYLRRTPEEAGYNAWLNYLNAHPKDFRTMVNGFMNSIEYRARFAS